MRMVTRIVVFYLAACGQFLAIASCLHAQATGAPSSPAIEAQLAEDTPAVAPTYSVSQNESAVWDPLHVDDFSLIDQTGQKVTLADLKGRPWVANFIFTRCVTQCPMMCSKIRHLLKDLNTDPAKPNSVRFVTITIDPRNDSLEKIQEFAGIFGAEREQWLFLTGEEAAVTKLIRHGFKVAAWENFGSDRLPGMEFAHSMHLIHVDETGQILGRYESLNESDLVTLQRVLEGKIKTPKRHQPAPAVPVTHQNSEDSAAGDGARLAAGDPLAKLPPWARRLPWTNASLNGLSTLLLLMGYTAIKLRQPRIHKKMMLYAYVVSIAFLGCYLTYHWALQHYTGEHGKKFAGPSGLKSVYYVILVSHVILAAAVPILTTMTIWRGLKSDWDSHRRWAKVTFPIWLYVSVTGVIIYWMLYHVSSSAA